MQEDFKTEGSWRKKVFVEHCPKMKMLEDRGAMSREEGDLVRAYKAMHEDLFSVVG